jgi:hypothetical protein
MLGRSLHDDARPWVEVGRSLVQIPCRLRTLCLCTLCGSPRAGLPSARRVFPHLESREPVGRPSAQHHHRACMLCKAICSGFGRWWCEAAAVPAVGCQKVAGEYGDRVTQHSLHLAAGLQQLQLTTTLEIIHRHSWQPSAAASSLAPQTAPRHAACCGQRF